MPKIPRRRPGNLTIKEERYCAEVARTGNQTKAAMQVYGHVGSISEMRNSEAIQERIAYYRRQFVEKYLSDIGDEIMSRARGAEDAESVKFYQLAVNIAGFEAPKIKNENRVSASFTLPAAVQQQLNAVDGEIIAEGGEDNESQEASEEADQEGREEEGS